MLVLGSVGTYSLPRAAQERQGYACRGARRILPPARGAGGSFVYKKGS